MVLVLDWDNLWVLAVPFMLCLSVASLFTVFLWRAAFRSGLPHRREPCVNCVFEGGLLKQGTCREACAVNFLPTLPLLLFLFCGTFALFFLFFSPLVVQYFFPSGYSVTWEQAIIGLVAASNGGSAILLAAYFVQDKAWHRELFLRGAVAATLIGLVGGLTLPSWMGADALELTPFALMAVLFSAGLEHRARWGRPVLGMRALALATVPLFMVTIVALFRILFVLTAQYPSL